MFDAGPFRSDDRATSTAVGYVLSLSITTVLVSGLLIAGGSYMDDQRQTAVRSELTVIGQQVSGDLSAADRLVRTTASSPSELRLDRRYPRRVAGDHYRIELLDPTPDDGRFLLRLSASQSDVSVEVVVRSVTDVETGAVGGGAVRISYDETAGTLVMTDG